ncbi:Chain length determinant protein [uncultured archaeon]|nr:Chain length determinant protein [uncultured archaeon]
MDDEIDLLDIFPVLWKRRLQIISVFIVAVLAAGTISLTTPSVYRASSIIAVGSFDDPIYTSTASVKGIMLSDEFLQEVFEQIRTNTTGSNFAAFKNGVKAEPVKDSDKLIEISVETPKKQEGLKAVEKMAWLYAKISEESYNKEKKILTDQLAAAQERLYIIDMEINQTREALQHMQDYSGTSAIQAEMRFSRALDLMSSLETQRSAMIDRNLDLQKQLFLITPPRVVQPAREPSSPMGSRTIMIIAIGGMLGLIIGIFVAFLREGIEKQAK